MMKWLFFLGVCTLISCSEKEDKVLPEDQQKVQREEREDEKPIIDKTKRRVSYSYSTPLPANLIGVGKENGEYIITEYCNRGMPGIDFNFDQSLMKRFSESNYMIFHLLAIENLSDSLAEDTLKSYRFTIQDTLGKQFYELDVYNDLKRKWVIIKGMPQDVKHGFDNDTLFADQLDNDHITHMKQICN